MVKDWDETGKNWAEPGARGENLRFLDFPAYHLMSLAGMAKQGMVRKHLEPWGLSMPEWRLLCTVAQTSPIRFSKIAQLTAMDKAQVSRALRTAQGKGLVESSVLPIGSDGEGVPRPLAPGRVHVSITAAGRELYEKVMPTIQRDQARLVELMSPEERRVLIRLVQRVFTQLQGENGREAAARPFRSENGELAAGARVSGVTLT